MNNGNSISLAKSFLPVMDAIYKAESKTSILDGMTQDVQFLNANEVKIFMLSMDGLGDYSRNTGFVTGDVTASWQTWALSKDRGRTLYVDRMDNEETVNMAFGKLVGEFMRTKVIPEVDAYRFAKYASTSGVLSATATLTKDTIIPAIDVAESAQGEAEVPEEGKILFITPTNYSLMKQSSAVTRFATMTDNMLNRNFEIFDTMRVVKVPQTRFYTAIDLLNGGTGQEAGGYAKASSGLDINFMIIHPSAVVQAVKHAMPRIFSPDDHQDADSWKFDYRLYHDAFVYENKVKGIYVHKKGNGSV